MHILHIFSIKKLKYVLNSRASYIQSNTVFNLDALQTEGLVCISVYPNIIETEFVWLSNSHYCQGLRCISRPPYILLEWKLNTDTALPLPYKSATACM
jgi:hypothetical protein